MRHLLSVLTKAAVLRRPVIEFERGVTFTKVIVSEAPRSMLATTMIEARQLLRFAIGTFPANLCGLERIKVLKEDGPKRDTVLIQSVDPLISFRVLQKLAAWADAVDWHVVMTRDGRGILRLEMTDRAAALNWIKSIYAKGKPLELRYDSLRYHVPYLEDDNEVNHQHLYVVTSPTRNSDLVGIEPTQLRAAFQAELEKDIQKKVDRLVVVAPIYEGGSRPVRYVQLGFKDPACVSEVMASISDKLREKYLSQQVIQIEIRIMLTNASNMTLYVNQRRRNTPRRTRERKQTNPNSEAAHEESTKLYTWLYLQCNNDTVIYLDLTRRSSYQPSSSPLSSRRRLTQIGYMHRSNKVSVDVT